VIVLADTSVWLDHWGRPNPLLAERLAQSQVVLHPFVFGEIALGATAPRAEVLQDLSKLHAPRVAQHREVLDLIERTPLWGCGIGWVDAHLLASTLLDHIRLWTLDRPLARVAHDLGVAA
jgi:predicted nucleic acid-binding protein